MPLLGQDQRDPFKRIADLKDYITIVETDRDELKHQLDGARLANEQILRHCKELELSNRGLKGANSRLSKRLAGTRGEGVCTIYGNQMLTTAEP